MRELELVGVPYTSMAEPGGIANAIGVLRSVGLAERLGAVSVIDGGDLSLDPPDGVRGASGILNEPALGRLVTATRDAVRAAHGAGRMPLLVGGDCPVILGPLAAVADTAGTTGLVMFDGHEDAWAPMRSPTGEGSDSELAIAIGRVDGPLPPPLDRLVPLVAARHVALLGPRDATEIISGGETSLRDDVALFLDDREVVELGGARAATSALEAIGRVPFWLHVDLDVLSTGSFRAVDYPQPGGLTWGDLDRAFTVALRHRGCRGASVAIYNPDRDRHGAGADQVVAFLARTIADAG